MNINKTNSNKSVIELRSEMTKSGVKMENVYVDGVKFCCVGYVNEKDKQMCLKTIQSAIDGSNDIYEAMEKLMANADFTDAGVEPDEQIEVDGDIMFIDYSKKAIYNANGNEIVNCTDIVGELSSEVCKEILTQRVRIMKLTNTFEEDECNN